MDQVLTPQQQVLSQTPRRSNYFQNSMSDVDILWIAKRLIRDLTTERESLMGPSDILD